MIWYIKTGILLFSALILAPLIYSMLRPNELSIKEGNYPVKERKTSTKFGEFKYNDLPSADMPVFGAPSKSIPYSYLEMEVNKEWLHPDITRRRDLMLKRKKQYEKENRT